MEFSPATAALRLYHICHHRKETKPEVWEAVAALLDHVAQGREFYSSRATDAHRQACYCAALEAERYQSGESTWSEG